MKVARTSLMSSAVVKLNLALDPGLVCSIAQYRSIAQCRMDASFGVFLSDTLSLLICCDCHFIEASNVDLLN
ncbi:hypothetical protein [Methylophaga sp.]|uniref:hypothetical protein n=1 Tax=Methylophaga sp. TaxID=2024840 RepID=UPI003A92F1C1